MIVANFPQQTALCFLAGEPAPVPVDYKHAMLTQESRARLLNLKYPAPDKLSLSSELFILGAYAAPTIPFYAKVCIDLHCRVNVCSL